MNKKDQCLSELRRRILTLALSPGEILDEVSLAEAFGISRTPMREILQRLAGEGYVALEKNRSAQVSPMDFRTMHDFFQTAPMIYASASRIAAENATPDRVAALKDTQAKFKAAHDAGEAGEMVMFNHIFHEQIGEMAANPYLTPSLHRLLIDHTRMSQTFYRPRSDKDKVRIDTANHQHDDLIEAIAAHEPARAVQITLEHWELSRDEIELYVRPDPLPVDPSAYEGGKSNAL